MSTALYLDDSYLKEWKATVTGVKNGKFITLDKTAFFPKGGGVPNDTGVILKNDRQYRVIFTGKFDGQISHEVDSEGLKDRDEVKCILDWERRYKLMRIHTACHILSSVFYRAEGALVTGNQLDVGQGRIDYDMEDFTQEKIERYIDEANRVFSKSIEVKIYYMKRDEALKIPEMVKLKNALPPNVENLRIVEVPGVDIQADGGPHVANTSEIGRIKFLRMENKGRQNRRVYIELLD